MAPAIAVAPHPGRLRNPSAGEVVAETAQALALTEGARAPVLSVPRGDVATGLLRPSSLRTTCP